MTTAATTTAASSSLNFGRTASSLSTGSISSFHQVGDRAHLEHRPPTDLATLNLNATRASRLRRAGFLGR